MILVKLSEKDVMYDLFKEISEGAKVFSLVEENTKRACSGIKSKIHSYLREIIEDKEPVIGIVEKLFKELGYNKEKNLRKKIEDLYVLNLIFYLLAKHFFVTIFKYILLHFCSI